MRASSTTETLTISEVKETLNALLDRISTGETRVLVGKSGHPVAALISIPDLKLLERLDRERAEQFKILEEVGAAFSDVPFEEIEREIEGSIAEVRTAREAEQRASGVGT